MPKSKKRYVKSWKANAGLLSHASKRAIALEIKARAHVVVVASLGTTTDSIYRVYRSVQCTCKQILAVSFVRKRYEKVNVRDVESIKLVVKVFTEVLVCLVVFNQKRSFTFLQARIP